MGSVDILDPPADDIAAFITARADELEAAAKAATPGPWTSGGGPYVGAKGHGIIVQARYVEDATHITLNDPDCALGLVRFMRAIADAVSEPAPAGVLGGHDDYGRGCADGAMSATRAAALWLAEIWDSHPDFKAAWKP